MKMNKKDFNDENKWKEYKNLREDLKRAEKIYNRAEERYQHIQNNIDTFKRIDPEGFAKVDNLTYTSKNGEIRSVDINITIDDDRQHGGGKTEARILDGKILGDVILTSIERGLGGRSDVLAHEFGHAIDIAKDPQKFYLETKKNPEHNCQDPANRNHPQSKTAMDWQERFNKKYKEYQKK